MCGRFVIRTTLEQIKQLFHVDQVNIEVNDNYNVSPTTPILVIVECDSKICLESFLWGLIPFWMKEDQVKEREAGIWVAKSRPWINTTAEKLIAQANFKQFLRKRCLILAWGYYEFHQIDKKKVPYLFQLESQEVFAFAGHWDIWRSPKGTEMQTCSIITTTPNDLVARLHNRMPVILDKKGQEIWMDPTIQDKEKLVSILKPYPSEEMTAYEVSPAVNSVKNNSPQLINPVTQIHNPRSP